MIHISRIHDINDETFIAIVKNSFSFREVTKKLGYNSHSGDLQDVIKKRIIKLNIDISHFKPYGKNNIKRTPENVFIINSSANQSTLRRWYVKGEYTPYICSICGQPPIWNNKKLALILDHINGCNTDDRLTNLRWVCPNCNMQLPTTNNKNKSYQKKCPDCGKQICKTSIRCRQCSAKSHIIPAKELQLSRDELKHLIRTTPFVQIGKQLGVTDNTIRKWCNKYNLPRKASVIKTISDEEWENI